MRNRFPRKLKKILKKRYAKVVCMKTVKSSVVAALGVAQVARVNSCLISGHEKVLKIIEVTKDTAIAVMGIMSESPTNWREA